MLRKSVKGVLAPIARTLTARAARILMYHRFAPTGSPRHLDAGRFEEHLRFLRKAYRVRPLQDVVESLRDGRPPEPHTVVLTVDDGYRDFLEVAYPLLVRYEMPATLYVVSEFVDGRMWLWFDAVDYLLHEAAPGAYTLVLNGAERRLELRDADSRRGTWHQLGNLGLEMTPTERWGMLAALQDVVGAALPGAPSAEYRPLSWDEVRALDRDLVEIGAHTKTHPILARCSDRELRDEIGGAREAVERNIGRSVTAFCYPNGRLQDVNDTVVREVRRAGFASAALAFGGVAPRNSDVFLLPRIGAPRDRSDLGLELSGLSYLTGRSRAAS